MLKRRLLAGFLFGLFMAGFFLCLAYFTRESSGKPGFTDFYFPAIIGGVLSGLLFGSLLGRFPKRKYEE
ncbi:MAG: hypothetical protein U0X40_02940 [Ferruginibacter sp.]